MIEKLFLKYYHQSIVVIRPSTIFLQMRYFNSLHNFKNTRNSNSATPNSLVQISNTMNKYGDFNSLIQRKPSFCSSYLLLQMNNPNQ